MLVQCSAPTSVTSTTIVPIRASTSIRPIMTRTWSSRSTRRYGGHKSSAAWSTSTHEPHDPITRAAGHGPRDEYWRSTGLGWTEDVLTVHDHDLLVNRQRRGVEVDVAPAQRGDLAAA